MQGKPGLAEEVYKIDHSKNDKLESTMKYLEIVNPSKEEIIESLETALEKEPLTFVCMIKKLNEMGVPKEEYREKIGLF